MSVVTEREVVLTTLSRHPARSAKAVIQLCLKCKDQRAGSSYGKVFQDMGIAHRRAHDRVPQQLLPRANVGVRLQQVVAKLCTVMRLNVCGAARH